MSKNVNSTDMPKLRKKIRLRDRFLKNEYLKNEAIKINQLAVNREIEKLFARAKQQQIYIKISPCIMSDR